MTESTSKPTAADPLAGGQNPDGRNPWLALWALVLGFFMILIDSTIVSVATDSIMVGLQTDLNSVVWVTSAYLLAYVVPLLVSGRLGDQFGPKNIYLIGLVIFTLASAWCGLSGSVEMLIAARAVQGLGAALMTPQTMAVITRTFPPAKRGTAMSLWGSVAGIAILVGPLAGGFLVDNFGWEWIFFVNVPVGVVAFVLAMQLVPQLPTHRHRFDVLGIVLSAVGLFLLTFGLQEGQKNDWDARIWLMIGGGVVVLIAFIGWQAICKTEPLMSLALFRDRNFSLGNLGIATMGFAVTGMAIPLMLFAQKSMGLSPMRAALLMVPLAVTSGMLARPVGMLTDRAHPRYIAGFGFTLTSLALWWLGAVASPTASVVQILLPIAVMGIGNAFIWAPLSATATRNLPLRLAGAGAGVYNMTRQVGAVLGSAAVGVLMQNQIQSKLAAAARQLPAGSPPPSPEALQTARGPLPAPLREPFAQAMGHSLWLPAAVLIVGLIAVLSFARPAHVGHRRPAGSSDATDPRSPEPASAEAHQAAAGHYQPADGRHEVAGGRHEAAGKHEVTAGRHEATGVAAPSDAPTRHRAD
ncbi:MFS transporter [Nakamurella aerolata]|uniref:MFS transporter n=1 Tax=Nakamurella aerolata TaxID=1656892 RepID=A0A849A8I4_9ACTN|nr:MFS transporter [Nakamurella aerolata]NNG36317.1 MFS transporter [Nakamurella aerolata]